MDARIPPDVYVLSRGWYGVTSTANQSQVALERLAELHQETHPLAYQVLTNDLYVDDILSGCRGESELNETIEQVVQVLGRGGFKTKFIHHSGSKLSDFASPKDSVMRVLGYRWSIIDDFLAPGFSELNFNKKKRGIKAANPFPLDTPVNVENLLATTPITRRMAVSKIAELWEPMGFFECLKINYKLHLQALTAYSWDDELAPDLQEFWTNIFVQFLQVPLLQVPRYVFPDVSDGEKRLLIACDAAAAAGGAVAYIGTRLKDGIFSNELLCSKSKLMSESVPRNELEAVRIGACLALDIVLALGEGYFSQIHFFTDSSIALFWCHNTQKRLRLFVLNRVTEIRRLIFFVSGSDSELNLYHVDGESNPADLVTKLNGIQPSQLSNLELWYKGQPWMSLPINEMPIKKYSDLTVGGDEELLLNKEYYPEHFLPNHAMLQISHCDGCPGWEKDFSHCLGSNSDYHCLNCKCTFPTFFQFVAPGKEECYLSNLVSLGWKKGVSVMSYVLMFIDKTRHQVHTAKSVDFKLDCKICSNKELICDMYEGVKFFKLEAEKMYCRLESKRLKTVLTPSQLRKYTEKDGILYYQGRLEQDTQVTQKGLDYRLFFDGQTISGFLPIVDSTSEVFYSFLLYVHHYVERHSGIEATLRVVMRKFYILNNPRRVIQTVRRHCSKCRLIAKKTEELAIASHPQVRSTMAPAFYFSMLDICVGFKGKPFKKSRSSIKIYAAVFVCLVTGATAIYAMDGIDTSDVVLTITRHSCRYGVPGHIFVDSGTQLCALEGLHFTLRDVNLQVLDRLGVEITVSTPKAHEERGRVERKIRSLREMLEKLANFSTVTLTVIEWETLFSRCSNELDELPICRLDRATNDDFGWDLLTPNRLKLGRSNQRSLDGPISILRPAGPVELLKRTIDIQKYWYGLLLDRLHHLVPRPPKWEGARMPKFTVGDIVIFRFLDGMSSKLETWKTGRIISISANGRKLEIKYPVPGHSALTKLPSVFRSPRDTCIVAKEAELDLNSNKFLQMLRDGVGK